MSLFVGVVVVVVVIVVVVVVVIVVVVVVVVDDDVVSDPAPCLCSSLLGLQLLRMAEKFND